MATGGFDVYPSYNNRYIISSQDTNYSPRNDRLSCISETQENEKEFGRLSFSNPPYFPAQSKRQLSRMSSVESHHSDDVFVENGLSDTDKKQPLDTTVSSASTVSIMPNPYNKLNHRFHSMIWCACCFYFVFFCCMPAVRFMEMSDKEYRRGNDFNAHKHGRTASACYLLGAVLSIVIYACILFLVIYFTKYFTS